MGEGFNPAVLKTADSKGSVGSNPTVSARKYIMLNMKELSNDQLISDFQSFSEIIYEEPDAQFIEGHSSYLYDVISELENRISNENLKKEIDNFDYESSELTEEEFKTRLDAILINLRLSLSGK